MQQSRPCISREENEKLEKFTTKPYHNESKRLFSLSKNEKNNVSNLQRIFQSGEGIYCYVGRRGTGKTSMKEIAKEKVLQERMYFEKPPLIIEIPFYTTVNDFYQDIIFNLWEKLQEQDDYKQTDYYSTIESIINLYDKEVHSESKQIDNESIATNKVTRNEISTNQKVSLFSKLGFSKKVYLHL